MKTPEGNEADVYVRLGAILADTEEMWQLTGIKPNSKHPDIRTMVPKGKLDDLTAYHCVRTEDAYIKALNKYKVQSTRREGKQLFKALSMRPTKASVCLWVYVAWSGCQGDKGLPGILCFDAASQYLGCRRRHLYIKP